MDKYFQFYPPAAKIKRMLDEIEEEKNAVKSVKCCLLCNHYDSINDYCPIKRQKVMIYNTCNDFEPDTDFIKKMEEETGENVEFK